MLHRKTKISYFDFALFEEDVGGFEVPMNDRAGVDLVVTVDDLVHEGDGLGLGEGPFVGDGFGEVSSVAELGDDVGVVAGVVNVIDFYDVVTVFEVFEDIDFGGE